VAVAWSLFQLWIASPLPFSLGIFVFNDTESRAIHLAFAVFLAYMAYPAFKRSPSSHMPMQDWVLALVGLSVPVTCSGSTATWPRARACRPPWTSTPPASACVLLLEATRRVLGLPMVIVAAVFLGYTFGGPYMPDMMAHRGFSLNRAMSHQWLTTEGVFGVALGVSSGFIFLFVLFGSLLDKAGAGNYFIKSAFALLGHMRGGPAKAAVVSSAATGIISGSSIANVVTTGTFTIPLMKRVGYRGDQAGAVEVSSSVNGQIMPPVMGAAAFLMVEYVGIPYVQVMKHAFLPAIISYIALFYIVHLEALKAGMQGLPRRNPPPGSQRLLSFLHDGQPASSCWPAHLLRHRLDQVPAGRCRRAGDRGGPAGCLRGPAVDRLAQPDLDLTTRTRRCSNCPRPGPPSSPACTTCWRWWCWSGA
jgi:TRAP transporter 4TM/12TM fusion protein